MLTRLKPVINGTPHQTPPPWGRGLFGRWNRSPQTNVYWKTSRLGSLPPQQFQILWTLFSEFCCNFPSRYLFALGLSFRIFSLGWNLPPVFRLRCKATLLAESRSDNDPPVRQHRGWKNNQQQNRILTLFDALFQGTWMFLGCGVRLVNFFPSLKGTEDRLIVLVGVCGSCREHRRRSLPRDY